MNSHYQSSFSQGKGNIHESRPDLYAKNPSSEKDLTFGQSTCLYGAPRMRYHNDTNQTHCYEVPVNNSSNFNPYNTWTNEYLPENHFGRSFKTSNPHVRDYSASGGRNLQEEKSDWRNELYDARTVTEHRRVPRNNNSFRNQMPYAENNYRNYGNGQNERIQHGNMRDNWSRSNFNSVSDNVISENNSRNRWSDSKNELITPSISRNSQRSVSNMNIPAPRQETFNGKNWESFIYQFEDLARSLSWNEEDMLFRIKQCLRDEASTFTFTQLTNAERSDYFLLREQLEHRFKERITPVTYRSMLRNRKLKSDENSTAYVASIKGLVKKAYPTADYELFQQLAVENFLNGLTDPKMAFQIDFKSPRTIEEAESLMQAYQQCKRHVKEHGHGSRVRAVDDFLSEEESDDEVNINKVEKNKKFTKKSHNKDDVTCFKCGGKGHFANECPSSEKVKEKREKESTSSKDKKEEN